METKRPSKRLSHMRRDMRRTCCNCSSVTNANHDAGMGRQRASSADVRTDHGLVSLMPVYVPVIMLAFLAAFIWTGLH